MNRRDFLTTVATLTATSAFARGQLGELRRDKNLSAAPPNSWPQFRGSAALTGISCTTVAPAPKLAWAWEGGEAFDSSAAIVDGVVYVGTFIGDLIGVVHAVNIADGKPIWTFKTQSEVKSSPVVIGDTLVIGSYDGNLYGLDAATGKPVWTYKTENYVHGTPSIVNGVAHFAGCDEVFHAVDVKTGKERLSTSATAYTGASVALVNNVAYFGTFDNQVLG